MILEIWSVTDRVYCNFGPFFCPFTPLTTNKIKILKKKRKTLKILSFYTSLPKMPFVWCMVPEIRSITERTFCHFWANFCHFTSLTIWKIKISKKKKWKKSLEISSFYITAPKIMIICYTVAETQCVMDVMFIFHFGLFFVLLPP